VLRHETLSCGLSGDPNPASYCKQAVSCESRRIVRGEEGERDAPVVPDSNGEFQMPLVVDVLEHDAGRGFKPPMFLSL